jgi:hypothetical protein
VGRRAITLAAIAVLAAALLAVVGCGDDENAPGAPPGVPAAGENTPPSQTPGVPEGARYDVDGRGWGKLGQSGRFEAASEFINDNPSRCEGADVGEVVGWADTSYGLDYPLDTPAAFVLEEGCAAALAD